MLSKLRACVLLSGSIRASDLLRGTGRSPLSLPADPHRSVLASWALQAEALGAAVGRGTLALRVLVDRTSPLPAPPRAAPGLDIAIQQDPADFRGTGGLLRDACVEYADDDTILVANGNQILVDPIVDVARELDERGGDVSLVAHDDGTPVGFFLMRVGVLRAVRELGYMDLKEQLLPHLARKHDVRVLSRPRSPAHPMRTLDEYIRALTAFHRHAAAVGDRPDVRDGECWFPTFSIVEGGARVPASARVHDSVVLKGAVLGDSAVVVRSVVAEGTSVPAGAVVADAVVDSRFSFSRRGRA